MNTTVEATAVAPISGKDVAVHTTKSVGSALHIGISALADLVKYGTAHAVHLIDKTQTIGMTADYIDARTDAKLLGLRKKLSGFKSEPIE